MTFAIATATRPLEDHAMPVLEGQHTPARAVLPMLALAEPATKGSAVKNTMASVDRSMKAWVAQSTEVLAVLLTMALVDRPIVALAGLATVALEDPATQALVETLQIALQIASSVNVTSHQPKEKGV